MWGSVERPSARCSGAGLPVVSSSRTWILNRRSTHYTGRCSIGFWSAMGRLISPSLKAPRTSCWPASPIDRRPHARPPHVKDATTKETTVSTHKHECDVLVIGSGAAGFAAAITAKKAGLDVLLTEKAPVFGGTTATSGGYIWIPGNHLMKAEGLEDDIDEARAYLRAH